MLSNASRGKNENSDPTPKYTAVRTSPNPNHQNARRVLKMSMNPLSTTETITNVQNLKSPCSTLTKNNPCAGAMLGA